MAHNYNKDCAICNCYHTESLFFNGSWHSWQKPSAQQVELRKKRKRSRGKHSY